MPLDPSPSATWENVRDRAGLRVSTGPGGLPSDAAVEAEATRLLELAKSALEGALEGAFRPVPLEELNELVLIVAKGYADRKRTTAGGQAQTTAVEAGESRPVARDPLAPVRGTLARYTVGLA